MPTFTLNNKEFVIESPGTPLTENDIISFERQIGMQLPPQLRSYYRQWNGGLPSPTDIPEYQSIWVRIHWQDDQEAAGVGSATIFSGMLEINSTPGMDWLRTWNDFKTRTPADCLCFARDPGGSLFLIGTHPHNLGKIFFWERTYEADEDSRPDYSNVAMVTDTLVDFFMALRAGPKTGESLEDWINRVYEK